MAGVTHTTESARTREQQAADQARALIEFADGAEEAGLIAYAQRARATARDTIWLVQALELERSFNRALKAKTDRTDAILANRVFCGGCRAAMRAASDSRPSIAGAKTEVLK